MLAVVTLQEQLSPRLVRGAEVVPVYHVQWCGGSGVAGEALCDKQVTRR
jgi:hypothetical protein